MVGFEKLNDLMQQEVSRKEFLRYLGIALLSLLGVASMLQNLSRAVGGDTHTTHTKTIQSNGYGVSAYGR